jgi:hypothetical protein
MRKRLSNCANCGEDKLILAQVSSRTEIIFLCNDCYILKYSNGLQKEIKYNEKKIKKKEPSCYGLGKFNYFIFKLLRSRFRL